jgi:hypothetical protein
MGPVTEVVTIPSRFRGPPESANGGYTCGLVAAALPAGAVAEVTLRSPPPLDRAMELAAADGQTELRDGETLVATAGSAEAIDIAFPDSVALEAAEAARESSPMQTDHPYPTCFVCGPHAEDGLHLTCGRVAGRDDVVAAPFEAAEWTADPSGAVRPELVWAALDCPGGIAGMLQPDLGTTVLGRLSVQIMDPVPAGRDYVAIGWNIGRDGRKATAGSAILSEDGTPLAVGKATWIEVR